MNGITIKQLYEMAKEKGYENAIIGMDFCEDIDTSCPNCDEDISESVEYVEEVRQNDITFGGYFNGQGERIYDCIWLSNHKDF